MIWASLPRQCPGRLEGSAPTSAPSRQLTQSGKPSPRASWAKRGANIIALFQHHDLIVQLRWRPEDHQLSMTDRFAGQTPRECTSAWRAKMTGCRGC
jgi:hypothetical protein